MTTKYQLHARILVAISCSLVIACSNSGEGSGATGGRFVTNEYANYVSENASGSGVGAQASAVVLSVALSILPPSTAATGGTVLYASDVKVQGNRVLTSYNVPGDTQKGWVDYIDVTTLAVPLLLDSKYFADTDINSLALAGGQFSLVGAKAGVGAVLRTGTYGLGSLTLSGTETLLPSFAGTGASYNGTTLAVTSGDTGKLNLMNSTTLAGIANSTISDARDVVYHPGSSKYFVVKGQPGELLGYNSAGNYVATTALGGASIAQSKSTVKAGTNFILATKGDGGFSLVCAADSLVGATAPQYSYPNYLITGKPAPEKTVTNAAVFGPGLIFTASGEAGVRVYEFKKKAGISPTACANIQVNYIGYFEFGLSISANNLHYVNILTTLASYTGILYIATGSGGFKAVTITAVRDLLNDITEF